MHGGGISLSLAHQAYKWIWQAPVCPNYDRDQNLSIENILAYTTSVRNHGKPCSGHSLMKKIGAVTGVNFKIIDADPIA